MRSSDESAVNAWVWLCAQAELYAERAADAASEVAAFHERMLAECAESMRRLHGRMAATHRRIEQRQRAAAARHRAHAERLMRKHAPDAVAPELLAVVAGALGARGAALTLLGSTPYEEAAIASNATAAAAQELEFTLGEGPVHDAAASRRLVVADETTMRTRWRQYSLAVTELGVRSVTAAPLCLDRRCFGVLTAFDPPGDTGIVGPTMVLAGTVLVAGSDASLMAADDRRVVHQATGMIAARLGCPVADALTVLRARAFAENEAIGVLARRIVDREILFD